MSALDSYGEIDLWDVSLITDMSALFEGKANFNTDIYTWDVSNVTNMQSMFLTQVVLTRIFLLGMFPMSLLWMRCFKVL